MAIATISNTGGLYSASSSWVGNFVPTSIDDVASTITSGPLTVDVPSVARSVNFGPYTNTLTMNAGLTVSGNVTIGLTMSISGTYGLAVNSSATMSSNGKIWPNQLTFAGASTTFTLIDDWVVDSLRYLTTNGSISTTNGKTITASNGLTIATTAQVVGSTKIILTGGTWSHSSAGRISMPIDLNGNINLGSNIYSGGGTISYVSGTINSTGNTFSFQTGTLNLVNTNSIDFNNFTVTGTSILNGSNFNLLGNLTISSGLSGTSTIVIKGTSSQTWTSTAYLSNNLTINKISGTLSLSANTYYSSGTMSFISGSVSTTGNTLNPVSCVLNTDGINWNNILFGVDAGNTSYTITLGSNLKVLNSFYLPSGNALDIINTGVYTIDASSAIVEIGRNNNAWTTSPWGDIVLRFSYVGIFNCLDLVIRGGNTRPGLFYGTTFNVNRNLSFYSQAAPGSYNGTSILNLIGTGNISSPITTGTPCYLPMYINTTGTMSFFNTITMVGTTFSYLQGNVVTTGSAQSLSSCVVNTKGVTWSNISLATCNIVSDFSATTLSTSGTINSTTSSITATSFTNTGTINNSTYSITATTMNNSGTINSGGITVNNLTVSGTINGGTTSISGNLTVSGTTVGTSNFILLGTSSQTWSHTTANYISNNLIVNKPSGTFSVSGNVYYQTGTFSYISGSVSTTSSTLNIGGSCNLQTNPITWFNINNAGAATVNLIDNLSFTGTWSASSGLITYTGSGNLSPPTSSHISFSGTSIITIPDSVLASTMSLITLTTAGPTTLRGNLSCNNLLTLGTTVVNTATGLTGSITTNGGLSVTGNASGTATIIIKSGTWSATNYIGNNLIFDGNSAVSGNVYYQTGTMSYISGVISTTNSTVNIGNTCRLDTNGINWNNFTFIGGTTTILSNLNLSGTLRTQTAVITLNSSIASLHKISMNSVSINAPTNGNAELVFNTPTTGTWSHATDQYLTNNLTFNHTGVVNMSGNIYYYGGTVSHITGSVSSGSSVVYMPGSTTLDTASMSWNEIRNWNTMNLILKSILNMNFWVINWATYVGAGVDGYYDVAETYARTANVTIVGTHSISVSNQITMGYRGYGLLYGNGFPTTLNLSSNLTVKNLFIWLSSSRSNYGQVNNSHSVTINNFSTTVTESLIVSTAPLGESLPAIPSLKGTSELIFKGNTWSAQALGYSADMRFYYEIPITIDSPSANIISTNTTIPNTIHFNNRLFKVSSGTMSTQMSFHFTNAIIDSQNYKFNNSMFSGTITLMNDFKAGNLTASTISYNNGTLIYGVGTTNITTATITGTGSINVEGNLAIAAQTSGNTPIFINGTSSQSWTASAWMSNNLTINKSSGLLTTGANLYFNGGTMSLISGSVNTTTNSTNLYLSSSGFVSKTTMNTGSMSWYNVFFEGSNATINLSSNLSVNNIFRITQVNQTFTTDADYLINCGHFQYVITSPTAHNVNISSIPIYTRDFTASGLGSGAALSINNNTFVSGDLSVTGGFGHGAHLYGGTISMVGSGTITTTSAIKSNLIINSPGKINFSGIHYLGSFGPSGMGGANMTYIKGNVVAKGATLSMVTNASYPYVLTGMNKIAWKGVLITSGANITMNEFFSGTPDVKTSILPSSTGTYSVTFTDNFEKVARYVNPTNLWIKPGQLLITTDGKKSFSTNRGIRYINSSPNGLSKNINLTPPQLGTFLLNDPTMTKF